MTAPTQHGATNNTSNGSDQVTTATIAVSPGDLVTIMAGAADASVQPAFTLHNAAGTLITEEETISGAADGVKVYKDGTSVNRTTTASSTGGTTVNCTAAVADDVGKRISDGNVHIPANTFITSVSVGVSYTISNTISGTLANSTTLTLSSDVGYDHTHGDSTNGVTYYHSIRIDPASSSLTNISVKINWGPTTGVRRYRVKTETPPSGEIVPLRANRIIAKWGTAGGSSGAGDYSAAKISGSAPNYPCVLNACFKTGSTSSTAPTVDCDGGGNKETTTSAGNGAGRVLQATTNTCVFVDGYWDGTETGTNAPPGANAIVANFSVNPTATKDLSGVLYAMANRAFASGGLASGTATAFNPSLAVQVFAGLASAVGQALDAVAKQPGRADAIIAAGVGTAFNARADVKTFAGVASATGQAFNPSVHKLAAATETDAAIAPTIYKIFGPEIGYADDTYPFAVIDMHATVSMTDAADAGDIRLVLKRGGAVVATGPWQALTTSPTAYLYTFSPIQGTGFSIKIDVRTTGQVDPVVTGMAPKFSFVAGLASAAGVALQPSLAVRQPAGIATGTGQALSAVLRASTNAGAASGVGTAFNARADVKVFGGVATAVGQGLDATVQIHAGNTNITPGVAAGVGTAFDASLAVKIFAGLATATGQGLDATLSTANLATATPSVAAGAATAFNPTVAVRVFAGLATGAGQAFNPAAQTTILSAATPTVASGVATAFNARVDVKVFAGVAIGIGRAFNTRGPATSAMLTVDPKPSAAVVVRAKYSARVAVAAKMRAEVAVL